MRLFIAIRLSDEMRTALVQCMHDLKKQGVEGNYVPAQNLHMTLAFIGEYKNPDKVKKVMEKVPLPQCRLSLSEKAISDKEDICQETLSGTAAKGRDDRG